MLNANSNPELEISRGARGEIIMAIRKLFIAAAALSAAIFSGPVMGLGEIMASGDLQQLGIKYADSVGGNDAYDVELTEGFAKYLSVIYKIVRTDFSAALPDIET